MIDLFNDVLKLKETDISIVINKRLSEFSAFLNYNNEKWFSELCFCLLTANSKAETAINIQNELGSKGFIKMSREQISDAIKCNKHRFHNNKSSFIVNARNHINIKDEIKNFNSVEAREFLVSNIKGLGYKESSHFLRNTGHFNLAILDRHIINLMLDYGYISSKPKTLTKKLYLDIESKFKSIADKLNMNLAELDLYMWYLKTGTVLK